MKYRIYLGRSEISGADLEAKFNSMVEGRRIRGKSRPVSPGRLVCLKYGGTVFFDWSCIVIGQRNQVVDRPHGSASLNFRQYEFIEEVSSQLRATANADEIHDHFASLVAAAEARKDGQGRIPGFDVDNRPAAAFAKRVRERIDANVQEKVDGEARKKAAGLARGPGELIQTAKGTISSKGDDFYGSAFVIPIYAVNFRYSGDRTPSVFIISGLDGDNGCVVPEKKSRRFKWLWWVLGIFAAVTAIGYFSPENRQGLQAPPAALPLHEAVQQRIDDPAYEVVRKFYEALGRGDGATASSYVIPEKREIGSFSAPELTHFYSSLLSPLVLISVSKIGDGQYEVHYSFAASNRHTCDGKSIVSVANRDGMFLIERIQALNGC